MPLRFAIQNGNWASGSTWNGFAQLGFPTASDDVWSNSYTVNMDTSTSALSLNNGQTPRVVENIATPAMTSNATPSGFVYASSFGAGLDPWRAFDQNTGTYWQSGTVFTGTLTYEFPTARNIKRYAIRTFSNSNATPRQWTFEGSNNNITFTILETVTASLAINSVYTSAVLANTASFTFYRLNITATPSVTSTPQVVELELTESTGSGAGNLTGGSFNFNTPDVSASVGTGINASNANLITVTATTGTVNISAPTVILANSTVVSSQIINHTGNCNLIITASEFRVPLQQYALGTYLINKTSTGTITMVGDITTTVGSGDWSRTQAALNTTAGNTVVIGNISGPTSTFNDTRDTRGINQTAGTLTVRGNVIGGRTNGQTTNHAINFSGTTLTITGSITGGSLTSGTTLASAAVNVSSTATVNVSGSVNGSVAAGIESTLGAVINVTGSVLGGSSTAGILLTGASVLNVRGTVTAGTGANGISSTSTSATNTIFGNLVNTNGIMAFYGPRLRIGSGSTTTWRFTTSTGTDRTLYTLDQIGDQPSTSNVRQGIVYASGSLTGTMAVPPSGSVALGVPIDNTTGSAVLNATYVSDEIWNQPTSTLTVSGSIGERIKNTATVSSTGAQIIALTGGN